VKIIDKLDPRLDKKELVDYEFSIYLKISIILAAISIMAFVYSIAPLVNLFPIPPLAATLGIIFAFIDFLITHKFRALVFALLNGITLVALISVELNLF
jgi:hypothetical protein